jgi:16S rRNA (adenine1518-N6/adenine1519-N6)-dimethyltransferase
MKDIDRQTRTQLQRLFEQRGLHPRHDLGQNFLVDLNLHELIVRHAQLSTADVVLEVGTGTGGLTTHLAHAAGHVVSIEYDAHVYGHAQRLLEGRTNVSLLHGDALASKHAFNPQLLDAVRTALERVAADEVRRQTELAGPAADDDNPWRLAPAVTTLKLVANLPYHVATPVMSNLMASALPWSRMVVTIQWELAQRMLASPGTSDYSALTVWLQSQAQLHLVRKLPPSVFWPPPKVDSAVLVVERNAAAQARIADRDFLHSFVRDIFTQRRKRLAGVLAHQFGGQHAGSLRLTREQISQLLRDLNVPADARAEQLPVATLVELSNRLTHATMMDSPPA